MTFRQKQWPIFCVFRFLTLVRLTPHKKKWNSFEKYLESSPWKYESNGGLPITRVCPLVNPYWILFLKRSITLQERNIFALEIVNLSSKFDLQIKRIFRKNFPDDAHLSYENFASEVWKKGKTK